MRAYQKTHIVPTVLALAIAACGGGAEEAGEEPESTIDPLRPQLVLSTSIGDIVLELDRQAAPETVNNLQRLVAANVYKDLQFHRVIEGAIIQTGVLTADLKRRNANLLPVTNEADNGLANVRGTVAMARGSEPHSASQQFFINLRDNDGFDHQDKTTRGWGYAVFGKVVEGMEIADSIGRIPTRKYGVHDDLPVEAVVIDTAYFRM